PSPPGPARIIAQMNQKGGVGKTTTTVNLAAGLALLGRRVLIVDLDPQAHATLHLGADPGGGAGGEGGSAAARSVYDLLLDSDDNPQAAIIQVAPNLALIPSETDLAAAEAELGAADERHRRLARALAPLAASFDAILIDCPPSLGLLTINGLAAANEVLIPMQAHFLALQGVGKLLETVKLVRAGINPGLTVSGVVLCMHDAQSTHAQEVVADLEAFFDAARTQDVPWRSARVFRPPIRRNIKLAECPSFGKTIFDYAPGAPGALDYRALAEAFAATTPSTAPSPLMTVPLPAAPGGQCPSGQTEVIITPAAQSLNTPPAPAEAPS
ncbi:MAG: ParA family protein, partial [Phycisphaerales bacterium]